MESYDSIERLVRKLEMQKWLIERLMNDCHDDHEAYCKIDVILERKISSLEESLNRIISCGFANLYEQWRDKVVTLWKQYFLFCSNTPHLRGKSIDSLSSSSVECLVDSPRSERSPSPLPWRAQIHVTKLPPIFPLEISSHLKREFPSSADESEDSSNSSSSFTDKINLAENKMAIREEIELDLNSIGPVCKHKLESMKHLLLVSAKGAKLLVPYRDDDSFQEEMYNLVSAKVPEDKFALFNAHCSVGIRQPKLRELKVFLSEQIADYYDQVMPVERKELPTLKPGQVFCIYCKQVGHIIAQCPQMGSQICFKCFQAGHKAKLCEGRKCFRCGSVDHFVKDCHMER